MLPRRLDEVLAQTDPFDLAQAAERYVHTLSAPEIRRLIDATRPRLNEYYAHEFSRVKDIDDGDSLRAAFAHELAANLRVIPLFGSAFAQAVLEHAPSERAVGFTDERSSHAPRLIAAAVVAVALAAVALGGARYVTATRSQSVQTSAASAPVPISAASQAEPADSHTSRVAHRRGAVVQRPRPPVTPAPAYVPPAPVANAGYSAPAAPPVTPAPRRQKPKRVATVPVAHGEAVVAVPVATRAPSVEETTPPTLDTTDMPQPYTDATPLPDETPVSATDVPRVMHVANPTPAPRHGWLHRTMMHLDPFKPRPQSTP